MGNRLIIAAAGSGKTTLLVQKALEHRDSEILITTFTDENEQEIRKKFIEINKCVPSNVTIQTWFSLLLQHGVKPYQGYVYDGHISGLLLYSGQSARYISEDDFAKHYLTSDNKIYSDKIAKCVCKCDDASNGAVIYRLSKLYTHIFIDEVQDLAGFDLEVLKRLFLSNIELLLVGDPRQGTYSTNNAAKNNQFRKSEIIVFFESQAKKNLIIIDEKLLNVNYRCTSRVCDFSNKLYPEMTFTSSGNNDIIEHLGVFFIRKEDVNEYLNKFCPVQLRDRVTVTTHPQYQSINFGKSKGLSFDRVLIYPTQPIIDWIVKGKELAQTSKAKLYVAITRARYSVGIIYNYTEQTQIDGIEKYK